MDDTTPNAARAEAAAVVRYPDLENKVVLITGAGNGLGRAMAGAFAANGARLFLLDIDNDALLRAKGELEDSHPGLEVLSGHASTADHAAVERLAAVAHGHYGTIDVLLNNAGIGMNMPTLELSAENWKHAIDVNLNGVFYCAQAVGRYMHRQGRGVILNMASMYGTIAAPNRAAYCASKAAVVMLTKALSTEWASAGIRVNAIGPGYIRTALVDGVVAAGKMNLDELVRRTPAGRLGTPDEIARVALFLASDHAEFINGQTLVADGGWSAYGYV